jgi:hypothetical protein
VENLMAKRLTMSRIGQAASHISHLATDLFDPKRSRNTY